VAVAKTVKRLKAPSKVGQIAEKSKRARIYCASFNPIPLVFKEEKRAQSLVAN